jgi:N-sulfoglucosamine sulfohydrolase
VAGLQAGRVVSELVSNVDVTPTLLEGLGLPAPANIQGRSFWPLLHGSAYTPREEVFAEKTFHTYYEPMRAVRTLTKKLIVNLEVSTSVDVPADIRESPMYPRMVRKLSAVRPPVELYDLLDDPWEQRNLADDPDVASVQADLRQRLLGWMKETDDPVLSGPVASPYYAAALASLKGE